MMKGWTRTNSEGSFRSLQPEDYRIEHIIYLSHVVCHQKYRLVAFEQRKQIINARDTWLCHKIHNSQRLKRKWPCMYQVKLVYQTVLHAWSIGNETPLIIEAWSLAKNKIALATSIALMAGFWPVDVCRAYTGLSNVTMFGFAIGTMTYSICE